MDARCPPWCLLLLGLAGCFKGSAVVRPGRDAGRDTGRDTGQDLGQDLGGPEAPFRCATDTDCAAEPSRRVCHAPSGACVECLAARDTCAPTHHCDDAGRVCVPGCRADDGCRGVTADAGAGDVPETSSGRALARCEVPAHRCVECLGHPDCPAGMLCQGRECVPGCKGAQPCPAGLMCCGGGCVSLRENSAHCGACDNVCAAPNGTPACRAGRCEVGACSAPYGDCNGEPRDGCEAHTLTDLAHCGGCGQRCPGRPHATVTCAAGVCGFTCDEGHADCDGDAANGCEVELATSVSHCGRCGARCALPGAEARCVAGACAVGTCLGTLADCDRDARNGCEADLQRDPRNCAACGTACATLGACVQGACGCRPPPGAAPTPLTGRIFAGLSFPPTVADVFEVTGGTTRPFARVPAGGWLGPLHGTRDGRLLAATNALGGSLWDVTAGGDLTGARPLARDLFTGSLAYIEGLANDEDGNLFLSNGDGGRQRVVRVSSAGAASPLPGMYDNPTGLWVCGRVLLISEGGAGRVLSHDLVTGVDTPYARGFRPAGTHISGQLHVDHRGRVLVLWSTAAAGTGLFDITGGGDFATARPVVPYPFAIDVNQIAIDASNNIYVAGDGGGVLYVSRFRAGAFAPFEVFARGLGDTESVAVGP
ncbi:MAG: hypothetical protein HY909_11695 [Deltaproteobacteria bacterium]|nr:hypothetical protein [Deltaproteobacteria bacterium]